MRHFNKVINNEVAGIKIHPSIHTHTQKTAHLPAQTPPLQVLVVFHFNKPSVCSHKLKIKAHKLNI